jgi:hypothetical protein
VAVRIGVGEGRVVDDRDPGRPRPGTASAPARAP